MGFSPQMFGVLLWLVLAVMGLRPGKRGLNFQTAALVIGLLFCLGPLGNVGVIDLRSYWWNPYMQPGLFMALVSGLLIAIRLWLAARSKRNKTSWPVTFDLITLLLVGIVGTALYYDHQQQAAGPIARMRSAGQTNPVDLQTLLRRCRPRLSHVSAC